MPRRSAAAFARAARHRKRLAPPIPVKRLSRAQRVLVVGVALLLPGLAAAQLEADDDPAAPPAEAAPATPDSGAATLEAGRSGAYRLEVRAPKALRELLLRHLDLARFREQPDISPVEVGRLLAATPAQVRSLLEPEGYFNARIEVQRVEAPAGGVPTLQVEVEPGQQARIGRVQLEMQGPLGEAIESGDESQRRRWERLQRRWTLQSGAAFSQAGWTAAKNALLADLRARGYANSSFVGTGAEVDAEANSVRLFVVVDSGPLYRIGEVRIEGLQRTPREAALNLLPFELGAVYSEKLLLDYQEALQKSGLYEGVAVELDLDPERAERATLVARLRENKLQSATVSAGYSTNTGPRIGLEHTHRQVFGHDLIATTKIKFGRDERSASLDLLTYPQPRGYRNLVGLKADYLDAGGAITQTERVRVGRQRDTERLDRLYYLEFNRTTVRTTNTRSTDRALLGNYEWVKRDVNSVVFPTRGLILSAQAGAGYAYDAQDEHGPFARLALQAIIYQPLGAGWLGQVRGEVAEVLKRDALGVPDTLLFRAGGDDSVRGYGYRTLGPVRDGAVVGGPVMATGTIEVMHRFSQSARWRDWYGALFVDAGNAALEWNELDPQLGYGVGVRWRSPIGPLRVDLAYGQQVQALRLHVSVGVSF
jgi:translocation and assembly module TamA